MRIGFYPFVIFTFYSIIYIQNVNKLYFYLNLVHASSIMYVMYSRLMQHNNKTERDTENVKYVDSIPGDEVCVVDLAGAGIIDDDHGRRLGRFIANEVLADMPTIANYSVVYEFPRKPILERKIQFDKYNQNIIPFNLDTAYALEDADLNIYVTEKNIESVFKRVIIPALHKKSTIKFKYTEFSN